METKKLSQCLGKVYSGEDASWLTEKLTETIENFKQKCPENVKKDFDLTAADMALITYANSVEDKTGKDSPLQVLKKFIEEFEVNKALPIVHILPFYPWDTDRGFSVKNYREVDPRNGNWEDIAALNTITKLMFDFVANHASVDNPLVQGALIERHVGKNDSRYADFEQYRDLVTAYSQEDEPSEEDLSNLSRPRPNPVLSPYVVEEKDGNLRAFLGQPEEAQGRVLGTGKVWTTFSRAKLEDGREDTRQVDLNFANPKTFLEIINILLFYIEQGAELIRLDAIAYIWKKMGAASVHEPQAHQLLRAMDIVLTAAAPGSITIAEVNEPEDSYFIYLGPEDAPESDMVYQFAHFPLAIHALVTEDASYYKKWLASTSRFKGKQFTTVLGSHDGLGVKPVREILPPEELDKLTGTLVDEYGALPNYGKLPGGQEIVYEAAGTAWNLINKQNSDEDFELQLKRYLAVIMLGLLPRGIPAIYINGLFGAKNYQPPEGLDENRTINREIFDWESLSKKLADADNEEAKILKAVLELLHKRAAEPAFAPNAPALEILPSEDHVIAVKVPAQDSSKSLKITVDIKSPYSINWSNV